MPDLPNRSEARTALEPEQIKASGNIVIRHSKLDAQWATNDQNTRNDESKALNL
jgi:hypothetical protein